MLGASARAAFRIHEMVSLWTAEIHEFFLRRNLPFNITSEEMYDIFGKYGAIRQIRLCVRRTRLTDSPDDVCCEKEQRVFLFPS